MVKKDAAEIRKERIQDMARQIQAALRIHGELSFSGTVNSFAYNMGLRKERVLEYLEIIEGEGQIMIDNDYDKIKKVSNE
jgi:hypothetical protein